MKRWLTLFDHRLSPVGDSVPGAVGTSHPFKVLYLPKSGVLENPMSRTD